jgi:cell division septal protein FtsQ
VRHAVVQRVWPGKLAVRLEEHQPAALWLGTDGNDRLVISLGEVFEATIGDVEDDALPRLRGPEGSAAAMLAMPDLARMSLYFYSFFVKLLISDILIIRLNGNK